MASPAGRAADAAGILSRVYLATYDLASRRVLACSENFEATAAIAREPGLLSKEALSAVPAHEYVHALDAERFGWPERIAALGTREARLAYRAAIEGYAQHIATVRALEPSI